MKCIKFYLMTNLKSFLTDVNVFKTKYILILHILIKVYYFM